ncbi:MAG TPA: CinA family protein [Gammaproteobacteria bacterium]|nr:CinA family protein [Gammaproteobacteria bacterium]
MNETEHPAALSDLARTVGEGLARRRLYIATAESCTAGLVAATLTTVAGSSAWFERGFVTYSNVAKEEMLGVAVTTLLDHGAVSEAVAEEMATGALRHSHAQVALAVTGIAGPGGGSPGKPVGTVCFGWAALGLAPRCRTRHFAGDREAVRRQAVAHALQGVLALLDAWDLPRDG